MPAARNLINRLLGRRRRPALTGRTDQDLQDISHAQTGDILVHQHPEHDDPFLIIERISRYTGAGSEWREIVAVNNQRRAYFNYADTEEGPLVTLNDDQGPLSIEALGLRESDLIALDEEHSTNNGLMIDGLRYTYRNSFEAFRHHEDKTRETDSFYMWDLVADDGSRTLTITKTQAHPFEAYFAHILDTSEVTLYQTEHNDA